MNLNRREVLPLKTSTGRLFTINREFLSDIVRELESFLEGQDFMNNKTFSKKVMFTHEIKANNTVEGINDSVSLIEKVIQDAYQVSDIERRNRIINLYKGYRYILERKEITEDTVSKLYQILSKDLLDEIDRSRMGDKYRMAPVYILQKGRLDDTIDHGIDFSLIPPIASTSPVNDNSPVIAKPFLGALFIASDNKLVVKVHYLIW